jgi:hypothetical protein
MLQARNPRRSIVKSRKDRTARAALHSGITKSNERSPLEKYAALFRDYCGPLFPPFSSLLQTKDTGANIWG